MGVGPAEVAAKAAIVNGTSDDNSFVNSVAAYETERQQTCGRDGAASERPATAADDFAPAPQPATAATASTAAAVPVVVTSHLLAPPLPLATSPGAVEVLVEPVAPLGTERASAASSSMPATPPGTPKGPWQQELMALRRQAAKVAGAGSPATLTTASGPSSVGSGSPGGVEHRSGVPWSSGGQLLTPPAVKMSPPFGCAIMEFAAQLRAAAASATSSSSAGAPPALAGVASVGAHASGAIFPGRTHANGAFAGTSTAAATKATCAGTTAATVAASPMLPLPRAGLRMPSPPPPSSPGVQGPPVPAMAHNVQFRSAVSPIHRELSPCQPMRRELSPPLQFVGGSAALERMVQAAAPQKKNRAAAPSYHGDGPGGSSSQRAPSLPPRREGFSRCENWRWGMYPGVERPREPSPLGAQLRARSPPAMSSNQRKGVGAGSTFLGREWQGPPQRTRRNGRPGSAASRQSQQRVPSFGSQMVSGGSVRSPSMAWASQAAVSTSPTRGSTVAAGAGWRAQTNCPGTKMSSTQRL